MEQVNDGVDQRSGTVDHAEPDRVHIGESGVTNNAVRSVDLDQ
jgi:hypothetical protein